MGAIHLRSVIPTTPVMSANSWSNRVKFIVRYMYDIDNNGVLDKTDFECLAVKNTIMEGKGAWSADSYTKNKEVMINLWNQIAEIADFDKNGEVDSDEFMKGVETACKGKKYSELPAAFKFFIEAQFRTIDVDGDGSIGLEELRYDCVNRMPVKSVEELDAAFSKISTDGDLTLSRYQEMYSEFLGNPDENCAACNLFGPCQPSSRRCGRFANTAAEWVR